MSKQLEIDDGPTDAPYGYKKDGSPKKPPGRHKTPGPSMTPDSVHAAPPLRRNNPRPPVRQQVREPAREPVREASTILGRNGEELTRTRPNSGGDVFDRVKPPKGWSYQWNAVTHYNKELEEIHKSMAVDMYENGWRPVPASRHPGIWTPPGYEGAIIVKGQRLDERPLEMTLAARREDVDYARAQLRTQTDALKFKQSQLPGANAGRAQQVSGIRIDIDKSFDLPPDENYDYGDDQ